MNNPSKEQPEGHSPAARAALQSDSPPISSGSDALAEQAPSALFLMLTRHIHEKSALPIAIALAIACAGIDALTGADITVNFLYQVPIFIGAWFRRWTGALSVISVAMIGRVVTLKYAETTTLSHLNIAWNIVAETTAFAAFALFVIALRSRERRDKNRLLVTTEQLRHAERLTTLGKLAAGVAHELGNPLHVVLLRADLIRSGKLSSPQITSAAEAILKQTRKMSDILRQLLDFGRRAATERARTDLLVVAREAADLVLPVAKKQDVEIRVSEGEPVWAQVNLSEMEQVIGNLLMNAVQASPPGSKVEVKIGRRKTAGAGGEDHSVAFVSVEDHGQGISPENLPHVFDPFFTTKKAGEGTGLGLSISFGIVSDHGGRIDVESRENMGSTFTVLLPS